MRTPYGKKTIGEMHSNQKNARIQRLSKWIIGREFLLNRKGSRHSIFVGENRPEIVAVVEESILKVDEKCLNTLLGKVTERSLEMWNIRLFGAALMVLTACATTDVTQLSKNKFLISTSAAPACGVAGARKVAVQMVAVETIRRGFERYIIVGADAQDNVSVINTYPTYANTTSSYNAYGNTLYGNSTTYFGGGGPMYFGSNDASLSVVMLNRQDQGFDRGIDAKATLGSEWKKLVEEGVLTCS